MSKLLDLSKSIPSWINEEFLSKIYKNSKISSLKVVSASKPGENFVGAVYRVSFVLENDGKIENYQLVLKTPSSSTNDTALAYLVDDFVKKFFDAEMRMYGEVLPEIEKLWISAGYSEFLSPKLIYQELEPIPVILLEDLSPKGFKIIHQPPEDFNVSIMIAKRLAKFHASSFFLNNDKKMNLSNFNGSMFNNPILTDVVYRIGLDAFIHVAEEKQELRIYADALRNVRETFLEAMREIEEDKSGILVLNHNDFHNKNVLFREECGKIADFYFIDFQICCFASLAIDLIYALYHFVSADNREKHRDEFISIYHHQFVKTLNDFNYCGNLPSLKSIHNELQKCKTFEILVAVCLTIFYYFDISQLSDEDLDFGEGTKKARIRMCRTEKYLKMLEYQLGEFRLRGVL